MTSFSFGPVELWLYWNPRYMAGPYITGPIRDGAGRPFCYFQLGLGILELVIWSPSIQ